MPAAKTGPSKPRKRKTSGSKTSSRGSSTVSRNVAAAKEKIVEGVASSLNVVLLTRKNIEEVIEDAVARGRMTQSDAQEMVSSLLQRGARATGEAISDIERLIGRSGGASPSSGSGLPIANYDDLSAAKVTSKLSSLSAPQLRKVRDYEKRNANRKTVLDPIERKLR